VQERFLREAGRAGIPFTIFRFGELSGSSRTGLGQTGDVMHRLLQMRMAIGCREKISADVLDMLPVDLAAKAIAEAGKYPGRWNRIYHATHPNPCAAAQLYRLAESQGYAFDAVSRERYLSRCMEYARFVSSQSPMDGFVLECILREADGSSRNMVMIDAYFALLFPFNQNNFLALLEEAKIDLPDWDLLLKLYFRRWSEEGTGLLARAREFIESEGSSGLERIQNGEAAAAASAG
jgi:hypothetical protein